MTTVSDILRFLSAWAPLSLAESYDNPGLLAGDAGAGVTRALIALDVTSAVCEEAKEAGAQLVISHHPVIFSPVRAVLRGGSAAALHALVSGGLSAVCMHTNLDAAPGGVNDTLLSVLGLVKTGPLKALSRPGFQKIVVFVPAEAAEAVRQAMVRAGAGRLGRYDGCAFESPGTGYFRPLAGASPYAGRAGELSAVPEIRVEALCRAQQTGAVVAAMKAAHPYELPAYDIFDDAGPEPETGVGALAQLTEERELDDFARFAGQTLGAGGVRVCRAGGRVQRLAVCSGAWDDELTLLARRAGADTLLTGEIKHSQMLLALELSLNVVAAGHFATENVICGELCRRMSAEFPAVSFACAQRSGDPSYTV